jgi:hypothetical protein
MYGAGGGRVTEAFFLSGDWAPDDDEPLASPLELERLWLMLVRPNRPLPEVPAFGVTSPTTIAAVDVDVDVITVAVVVLVFVVVVTTGSGLAVAAVGRGLCVGPGLLLVRLIIRFGLGEALTGTSTAGESPVGGDTPVGARSCCGVVTAMGCAPGVGKGLSGFRHGLSGFRPRCRRAVV